MKAALTMDMLATDIADYLVRKGVSSTPPQLLLVGSSSPGAIPGDTPHLWPRRGTRREDQRANLRPLLGTVQGALGALYRGRHAGI